jgi:hypothetical protein
MPSVSKPITRKLRAVAVLCGGVALGVLPLAVSGGASATTVGPHIRAVPNDLMVNTDTQLTGSGWPAHTSITLSECGKTTWVAPDNPCNPDNTLTVTTSARGRFKAEFKAETCPEGKFKGPGFQERCFIGEATPSGVDTLTLIGAARIIVTGP